MKKIKTVSAFILFILSSCHTAQAQVLDYVHDHKNMDSSQMFFHHISHDDSGNTFRTGNLIGKADFDFGQGVHEVKAKGNIDNFIAKYNASGELIWIKTVVVSRFTNFNFSKVDAWGDLIVAGYFFDSMQFETGNQSSKVVSEGYEDVFVMKLDAMDGSFKWIKRIGNYALNYTYGFDVNKNGDIIVAGRYSYDMDVDPGTGEKILKANIKNNSFIVELSKDGEFKWERHLGGEGHSHIYNIRYDVNGDILACGSFVGAMALFSDDPTDTIATNGVTKAFLVKLNSEGKLIWSKLIDGVSYSEFYSLDVNVKGQIIVAGTFQGKIWLAENDTMRSNGNYDIFIIKYDSSGNIIWHKDFGGIAMDYAYAVRFDDMENVYVVGLYGSQLDIDPGDKFKGLPFNGLQDGLLLKLDYIGNYRGSSTFNGSDYDYISLLFTDGPDLYFSGYYTDTAALNLTGQYYKMPGQVGEEHSFVVKMSGLALSIDTKLNDKAPMVYPNPVRGSCIVKMADIQSVEVLDLLGRQLDVSIEQLDLDSFSIDMTGLVSGTYLIRVIGADKKLHAQLVQIY